MQGVGPFLMERNSFYMNLPCYMLKYTLECQTIIFTGTTTKRKILHVIEKEKRHDGIERTVLPDIGAGGSLQINQVVLQHLLRLQKYFRWDTGDEELDPLHHHALPLPDVWEQLPHRGLEPLCLRSLGGAGSRDGLENKFSRFGDKIKCYYLEWLIVRAPGGWCWFNSCQIRLDFLKLGNSLLDKR